MTNFQAVIQKHYRGKPGPYIRELIERDLRGLSIGMPESAFDVKQIAAWMRAERTLHGGARHALTVLNARKPEERAEAARILATLVIEGVFPEDQADKPAMMFNESAAKPAKTPTEKTIASLEAIARRKEPAKAGSPPRGT